ncbi:MULTISPECIES: hypothetical protein [Rhodomicrobium]|uniref:hypothetical protein n=1 Tax=Rhodomicrobium TaxID=1068 RepID=UPI000B4BF366|nr:MULTISPECIES: hypothetical protein [Rhodomicrobium]
MTAPTNGPPVFARRLLLGFIAAAIGTFVLSLYLMTREDHGVDRFGPSSYSSSAIGYAGIAAVLDTLGLSAVKSRSNSVKKAEDGLLVVAEPRITGVTETALPALMKAKKILLVLPKWSGIRDRSNGGWVEHVIERTALEAERTLALALAAPNVARVEKVEGWTTNTIGPAPGISAGVHLMKSDKLTPLVAAKEGILLGEIRDGGRRIWVLSDPDVLNNQSFGAEGKGALFGVEMMKALRGGAGPIVFDETVHGFVSRPAAAAKLLFEFPYVVVTILAGLGAGLLLWATMGRFGPPEAPPAPLVAGKQGLVDNVARLMEFGGHEKLMVRRYVEVTIRDAARQLHAPKGLPQSEMIAWLRRTAEARNVGRDSTAIFRRADELIEARGAGDLSPFVDVAQDIYRWKQEILDGPSRHPRRDRGGSR